MTGSLLKRLKTEPTPIIDTNTATFVWKGVIPPHLVGDFTGWDEGNPAIMLKSKPGMWTYHICLPPDAYIEYVFLEGEERISDPFNMRLTPNGLGGYNNYFSMPAYQPTSLIQKNGNIPHGIVTTYRISTEYLIFGKQRTIHLYQPPVKDPVPLIVVWDGQDYLRRAHLNTIVDNLISQGRIQPLALAFVDNGGQQARMVEYACSDATLSFLMTEVIPMANNKLNLIDIHAYPGTYGVLGASMGGLMALYTGARIPHVFGNVFSQSGAFSMEGIDVVIIDLVQQSEMLSMKIWMDVGNYDLAGLLDSNRTMRNILKQKGYPLHYHEYNAGHNFHAWRDDIWRGLEALYGVAKQKNLRMHNVF